MSEQKKELRGRNGNDNGYDRHLVSMVACHHFVLLVLGLLRLRLVSSMLSNAAYILCTVQSAVEPLEI